MHKVILFTLVIAATFAVDSSAQTLWDLAYGTESKVVIRKVRSLYSDIEEPTKEFKVGDLVTVYISEQAIARLQAKTEGDSSTDVKTTLDNFIRFNNGGGFRLGQNLQDGTYVPEVGISSETEVAREGRTERRNQYTDRLGAVVVYKHENGTLEIEGHRTRLINGETEQIAVTGLVDPQDISADGIVRSEALANAHLTFTGEGDVSDFTILSWFQRALSWLWPF
ncbi:MAG: flagellar basal body L-ring protein FlgH [Planctomycetes bacterium]|nr:flagellar basal body L-ring protein FlgH [Planctomycetota bacterium]